jgi:hypothetical protein
MTIETPTADRRARGHGAGVSAHQRPRPRPRPPQWLGQIPARFSQARHSYRGPVGPRRRCPNTAPLLCCLRRSYVHLDRGHVHRSPLGTSPRWPASRCPPMSSGSAPPHPVQKLAALPQQRNVPSSLSTHEQYSPATTRRPGGGNSVSVAWPVTVGAVSVAWPGMVERFRSWRRPSRTTRGPVRCRRSRLAKPIQCPRGLGVDGRVTDHSYGTGPAEKGDSSSPIFMVFPRPSCPL